MKKIKVNIISKGFGFAFGKTKDEKDVYVKNGDLKKNATILDAIILEEDKEEFISSEIPETYESHLILEELMNDEGLIKINSIDNFISNRQFELKKKWLFPHKLIGEVIDYILSFEELKSISKIAITNKRFTSSSARIFGLSFKQALEKLERMGIQQARLYCENKQNFSKEGVVAEMLVNLTKDNNEFVSIETWQGVEGNSFAYYTHGIMNKEKNAFQHFDGAIIGFEISELNQLFRENRKLKGCSYKKLFRLDGEISFEHVFELANRFFPLDNLINEYFEVEKI